VRASAAVDFRPNPSGVDALLHSTTGPYAQWLARVGNRIVNSAKRRAPVDTGLMRSRIEFRLELQAGVLVGTVEAKTAYSWYVHNGTRGRAGRPFLADAAREVLGSL
jgi:HK97 gp10 family phage protein